MVSSTKTGSVFGYKSSRTLYTSQQRNKEQTCVTASPASHLPHFTHRDIGKGTNMVCSLTGKSSGLSFPGERPVRTIKIAQIACTLIPNFMAISKGAWPLPWVKQTKCRMLKSKLIKTSLRLVNSLARKKLCYQDNALLSAIRCVQCILY